MKNKDYLKIKKHPVLIAIIIFAIACIIGFLSTAMIYYLFTQVMISFFNIFIPFSWTYALGVWLIVVLLRLLFGGLKANGE